jgi:hypothetical protein
MRGVRTHVEMGGREVGQAILDGEHVRAQRREDRRRAHVVRRHRDGPGVPPPLRVLHARANKKQSTRSVRLDWMRARLWIRLDPIQDACARGSAADGAGPAGRGRQGIGSTHGERGAHAERADDAAGLGQRDAGASSREPGERLPPAGYGGVDAAFAVDADVLQPLPRGGGQPQRTLVAGVAHATPARALAELLWLCDCSSWNCLPKGARAPRAVVPSAV